MNGSLEFEGLPHIEIMYSKALQFRQTIDEILNGTARHHLSAKVRRYLPFV